jgi:TRAP-type mannitol/chloroaromatic compound transport system substrate-binding protein
MPQRLVAGGAQLRPFSQAVPISKKVWEAMLAFRNDEYLWWQVAGLTYDTYLVHNRTRT